MNSLYQVTFQVVTAATKSLSLKPAEKKTWTTWEARKLEIDSRKLKPDSLSAKLIDNQSSRCFQDSQRDCFSLIKPNNEPRQRRKFLGEISEVFVERLLGTATKDPFVHVSRVEFCL